MSNQYLLNYKEVVPWTRQKQKANVFVVALGKRVYKGDIIGHIWAKRKRRG